MAPCPHGGFVVETAGGRVEAAFVLFATGVVDRLPPADDAWAQVQLGLLRQCPVCDAFEVIDKRLAVVGEGDGAAGEALFLRGYSADVTLLSLGPPAFSGDGLARLAEAGVTVAPSPLARLERAGGGVEARLRDGGRLGFDAVYSGLGVAPRTALAARLGLARAADDRLQVDARQRCSLRGVYAAGDVVTGLNQIAVAMAQAEIAATHMHAALRRAEGRSLEPAD